MKTYHIPKKLLSAVSTVLSSFFIEQNLKYYLKVKLKNQCRKYTGQYGIT